jgi:hypothetical protein
MSIDLFLSHADTHDPVLSGGLPRAGAHEAPQPAAHPPTHLADRGGLPDALPDQRWGLIVPRGDAGKRLLDLVAPLKQKRAEDQRAEVVVYEVDPDMGPEEANRWIGRDYQDRVQRREEDLPRYLLVLGGPEVVSWDLQQMLGNEAFVGRLAFGADAGYEAYVDKALRRERPSPAGLPPDARAILYTAQDGSNAIAQGHEHLMKPIAATLRELSRTGKLSAQEIVEIGGGDARPSIDDLLDQAHDLLAQAERAEAALLFSMTHGLGAPANGWSSPGEQRALQGAMKISAGNDRITAADIQGRRFLPGGLWLMFACFGAGTPSRSAYAPWLERLSALGLCHVPTRSVLAALPREGERPFVAALAEAALANPDGPLGVIGHVDLAWTWSFLDDLATAAGSKIPRGRHERFQEILRSTLRGQRFGVAHGALAHFFGEINQDLATMYDESVPSRAGADDPARMARRADLWMQRQDLAGHVLLGDPAARLPIAQFPPGIPEPEEDDAGIVSLVGGAPKRRDPQAMEAAVMACFRGAEAKEAIAGRYAVTTAELDAWVETYRAWGRRGLTDG